MFLGLTLEQWAFVGTIANPIISLLALAAIVVAWQQLRETRDASAVAEANAIHRSLIEKSLEFPKFIAPNPETVNTKDEEFDCDEDEFRRYESFVELMLTTFEELAPTYSDKGTQKYMVQWLAQHRKYLDSNYFRVDFWDQLSPQLQNLVEAAIEYDKQHAMSHPQRKKGAAA